MILILLNEGIAVSLEIGGDIIKMLFSRIFSFFIDDAAFPRPFWNGADSFFLIRCFHRNLLDFSQ